MNVRLRAMEPADLELLYQVENDSSSWDIGATTMPFSHDVLYTYIINTTGDIFIDKQVRLIIETTDGTAVGIVDLTSFDPKNRHAEVGIAILPQYREQRFASEALHLLEGYSRDTAHIHTLYAIVPCDNIASRKLFESSGFLIKTEINDWLYDGQKYKNALFMQKIL